MGLLILIIDNGEVVAQNNKDSIYVADSVDTQPEYPGGKAELYKYLGNNIRYPKEAQDKFIQGKVYAKFVINVDGSIGEVKIVRSVHKLLDDETVRVIKTMPNWIPAEHKGQKVAVWYKLPINYKISGNRVKKKNKKNGKR